MVYIFASMSWMLDLPRDEKSKLDVDVDDWLVSHLVNLHIHGSRSICNSHNEKAATLTMKILQIFLNVAGRRLFGIIRGVGGKGHEHNDRFAACSG